MCQTIPLIVVYELTKGYPIFQTEVHDPYPHINGGQQLGALRLVLSLPLHKYPVNNTYNKLKKSLLFFKNELLLFVFNFLKLDSTNTHLDKTKLLFSVLDI